MNKFKIDLANSNKRIDLVVMEMQPSLSRSKIKKLLADEKIKVNGKFAFANYKTKKGDVVTLNLREEDHSQLKPFKLNLEIIYEDDDLIVINKPTGINSHPSNTEDTKSLLNALYYNFKGQNFKIRLVNRLDKETSGIILATKNLKANEYYSDEFKNRRVKKTYLAVVQGNFEHHLKSIGKTREVVSGLLRKVKDERRAYISSAKGDFSRTTFYFHKHFKKDKSQSVILAEPETGRYHQIRVHLSYIGFPILGDKKYGGDAFSRVMLHSHKLKLKLKSGKEKEFLSEVEW